MTKRDPGRELARALGAAFATFQGAVKVEELASRPWASITFTGARHRLRLRLEGEDAAVAADAFLSGVSELEIGLHGHILAEIVAVAQERTKSGRLVRLDLEALTVED